MAKTNTNYFRVEAAANSEEANLYIYGFIGQDYDWSESMKERSLTDFAVVKKIGELEASYKRINVRINSPGGSVYDGAAILTALLNSPAEIHTYIDGLAASMASYLWLAGTTRHMAAHSKLMLHACSSFCYGTALDMMEEAEMLEKHDSQFVAVIAELTGMPEEDVRNNYFDYRDHWITAQEANELGFIEEIESYKGQEPKEGVENMTHAQLIQAFKPIEQPTPQPNAAHESVFANLKQRILQWSRPNKVAASTTINNNLTEMKTEDFNKSLGGDLPLDAVVAALQEKGYQVTEPTAAAATDDTPPAKPSLAEELQAAVTAAVKPLNDQIKDLQTKVQAYGDLPAATATDVGKGQDGADGIATGTEGLDAIKALAEAANAGERVDTLAD